MKLKSSETDKKVSDLILTSQNLKISWKGIIFLQYNRQR